MGWGSPTRTEKRVKQTLLARLDGMAARIFEGLQTEKGLRQLQAFIQAVRAQPGSPPRISPLSTALPIPETSIGFCLNQYAYAKKTLPLVHFTWCPTASGEHGGAIAWRETRQFLIAPCHQPPASFRQTKKERVLECLPA
jgi:hypothetical protein